MTTLLSPLRRALSVGSRRTATTCCGREHTYEEVWERCCRLIGGLLSSGLGPGDRVAVVGPNCHRFLELYQAVPGAGMHLVPLNPRHAAAELRYALGDSEARVLFTGIGEKPPLKILRPWPEPLDDDTRPLDAVLVGVQVLRRRALEEDVECARTLAIAKLGDRLNQQGRHDHDEEGSGWFARVDGQDGYIVTNGHVVGILSKTDRPPQKLTVTLNQGGDNEQNS